WTVTDTSGNTATDTQLVTVEDKISPEIIAPGKLSVNADPGTCSATGVNLGTPATSDNCGVPVVDNDAPDSFPIGTTTVIWTVIDNSGNTTTASQKVIVNDVEAPVIYITEDIEISADSNACTASSYNHGPHSATDNCGTVSL